MKKRRFMRSWGMGILCGLMALGFLFLPQTEASAKNVVIVIDPGHGGENEGGKTEVYLEKEITLRTAMAMKEELEKYEGVTVYLTRETDKDMDLDERVAYAKKVNADFFFSLHYNMSEYHTLYGTECWISAFGDCHAKGYDCAKIVNETLASTGLANRGIKMRLGKKGSDYYGVIRHATADDIPSMIIEHCHMDQEKDAPYLDLVSWPEQYGVLDATAVAKYYHLKSEELGVDYSDYSYEVTKAVKETLGPDTTEPENLQIQSLERDEEAGLLHLTISAEESYSKLMYYCYSLDGGTTFTDRETWPEGQEMVSFDIPIPVGMDGELVLRVYNNYDLYVDGDAIAIAGLPYLETEQAMDDNALGQMQEGYKERTAGVRQLQEQITAAKTGSVVCIFMAILAFVLCIVTLVALGKKVIARKVLLPILLGAILACTALSYVAYDNLQDLQQLEEQSQEEEEVPDTSL